MNLLAPKWEQPKPPPKDALAMCGHVELASVDIHSGALVQVLESLRRSHSNGGAHFSAFRVGESEIFDWFASRNRLAEYDIVSSLLGRSEVQMALPELRIPPANSEIHAQHCSIVTVNGFEMESSFLFDGRLARTLYCGGAYGPDRLAETPNLGAKEAKQLALRLCDELFEQRFSEVDLFNNYSAWTPWFHGIAWDWTALLFDRRKRMFSILAITDTD